jgi:Protein of unknown function (DUF4065)
MHFVISSTQPEELGKTKLAKVLFFSDLEAFRRRGRPMTEARYVKKPHGPMPVALYDGIRSLECAGKIAQRSHALAGYTQHQFWAKEEPDLSELTGEDVAILSDYTRFICENHTATSISDLTHNAAWKLATDGEEIPFAAFIAAWGRGQPTANELAQIDAALTA